MDDQELCYSVLSQDSFIMVNKKIAKEIGWVASVLLHHLIYKEKYFREAKELTEDGFFFQTIKDLEDQIFISRELQDKASSVLIKQHLIITDVRGVPPKKHFKINHPEVMNFLSICGNSTNQFAENTQNIITNKSNTNQSMNNFVITRNGVPRKNLVIRKQSIREIHKQEKQKLTPVKSILVPVSVKEIIDYWGWVGLKVHDIETKAFKSAVKDIEKVLNGTMFADYTYPDFVAYTKMKFSVDKIKRAIDRHLERRFNVEYLPTNKEPLNNITLSNFFFNRFVTIEAYKSEFLICYCKPLVKTTNNKQLELNDDQPNVTKLLENWYKKTFAYKINGSYSVMDRNTIIKTGRVLREFIKTNNKTLNISRSHFMMHGIFNDPVLYLAESLTRLFDEELRNNDTLYTIFEPSWLISELTMTSRLPKFLKNEGVLR